MNFLFTNKQTRLDKYGPWVLVTGASEGIGKSFAVELAEQGFNLLITARRGEVLAELALLLQTQYSVQCIAVAADLSEKESVQTVIDASHGLDIGLVVCAAGFGTAGDYLSNQLETELNLLQVNCTAITHLTWALGQKLKSRGKGGLILLSSIVAFQGVQRSANYAASKAYVQSLGEGLRLEWAAHGVDVLCVAPGPVETGFAYRANLTMGATDNASDVAKQSLTALGKQTTVRPGLLGKMLGYSLAMTPRFLRLTMMSAVMKGMVKTRSK